MFFLLLALGADWPHLRGPRFDAVSDEKGIAEAWPEGGPPLLWSRDLGEGYSGFVVAEGRAFTQRQAIGGQYLLCLDAATGRTLWETRYDWAWQPRGAYPGPYASPTCQAGRVWFASPTGLVGCADARTGRIRWSLNVVKEFGGTGTEFGYASTPLVEDGLVILPVGGEGTALVALRAEDGRPAWKAGSGPASYCPAFPLTLGGRRRVVGYLQNHWMLCDLKTGEVLHRSEMSDGYDEHSAWPLWHEPDLFLASPFRRGSSCLRLGPGDPKPRWASREMSNDIVSSLLHGGRIYGFDLQQLQASKHRPARGVFRCLDWSSGKTLWSTKEVGQASPLAADGKLILFSDTGMLHLARLGTESYQELARVRLFDEVCWSPPCLSDGRLIVRSPSRAVCVHLGTGEVPAAPYAVRSWRFDPAWLLAREREYPNDAFSWAELRLWFLACLAVLCLSSGISLVSGKAGPALGAVVGVVLGWLGPNVGSRMADALLFTWPAALFAVFQPAALACARASSDKSARLEARLRVGLLLAAGWLYFEGCRMVGMFVGWAFLAGLPAALPFAWLASMRASPAWRIPWMLAGFAAFYWCGPLVLWVKG